MIARIVIAALMALCAAPAAAGQMHIIHCLGGCPSGTPDTNDTVIRQIYALSANPDTKFADWVAYHITRETMGTSASLSRSWKPDGFLDKEERLEPKDYKGIGTELDSDRGHLAPLASFAGTVFWRDTNILSNIAPQRSDLNKGSWLDLEDAVRELTWAKRRVWVMAGPLYEKPMKQLGHVTGGKDHTVPSAFWKVVATEDGKIAAFIFEQSLARSASHCAQISSLNAIETRSGLTLFPNSSPGWVKETLKGALGC